MSTFSAGCCRFRCAARLQERSPSRSRRWRELPGIERVPARGQAVLTFRRRAPTRRRGALLRSSTRLTRPGPRRPSSSSASRSPKPRTWSPRSLAVATRSGSTGSGTSATTESQPRSQSPTSRRATPRSRRRRIPPLASTAPLRKALRGWRRGLPPPRPRGRLLVDLGPRLGAPAGRAHRPPGEPRPRRRGDRPAPRLGPLRGATERRPRRRGRSRRSPRALPALEPRPGHPRRCLRRALAQQPKSVA